MEFHPVTLAGTNLKAWMLLCSIPLPGFIRGWVLGNNLIWDSELAEIKSWLELRGYLCVLLGKDEL